MIVAVWLRVTALQFVSKRFATKHLSKARRENVYPGIIECTFMFGGLKWIIRYDWFDLNYGV